jgi:hypothetical protein
MVTHKIERRYLPKYYNKLSHAAWQCKYHTVWWPKNRFRILKGQIGNLVPDRILATVLLFENN